MGARRPWGRGIPPVERGTPALLGGTTPGGDGEGYPEVGLGGHAARGTGDTARGEGDTRPPGDTGRVTRMLPVETGLHLAVT